MIVHGKFHWFAEVVDGALHVRTTKPRKHLVLHAEGRPGLGGMHEVPYTESEEQMSVVTYTYIGGGRANKDLDRSSGCAPTIRGMRWQGTQHLNRVRYDLISKGFSKEQIDSLLADMKAGGKHEPFPENDNPRINGRGRNVPNGL